MLIHVIGGGIAEVNHLTLEAVAYLKKAKMTFYLPTKLNKLINFLSGIGVLQHEDLSPLYQEGAIDKENYHRIVNRLIAGAREYDEICFLIPGNPRLGTTTVSWLEQAANELNISINLINGISSLDCMMNDLRIDPLQNGTIIMDANRLLETKHQIDTALDYYIYHICSVGTERTFRSNPKAQNKLEKLQAYLEQFYPHEHKCLFIRTQISEVNPTKIDSFPLKSLTQALDILDFGTTLFIKGSY